MAFRKKVHDKHGKSQWKKPSRKSIEYILEHFNSFKRTKPDYCGIIKVRGSIGNGTPKAPVGGQSWSYLEDVDSIIKHVDKGGWLGFVSPGCVCLPIVDCDNNSAAPLVDKALKDIPHVKLPSGTVGNFHYVLKTLDGSVPDVDHKNWSLSKGDKPDGQIYDKHKGYIILYQLDKLVKWLKKRKPAVSIGELSSKLPEHGAVGKGGFAPVPKEKVVPWLDFSPLKRVEEMVSEMQNKKPGERDDHMWRAMVDCFDYCWHPVLAKEFPDVGDTLVQHLREFWMLGSMQEGGKGKQVAAREWDRKYSIKTGEAQKKWGQYNMDCSDFTEQKIKEIIEKAKGGPSEEEIDGVPTKPQLGKSGLTPHMLRYLLYVCGYEVRGVTTVGNDHEVAIQYREIDGEWRLMGDFMESELYEQLRLAFIEEYPKSKLVPAKGRWNDCVMALSNALRVELIKNEYYESIHAELKEEMEQGQWEGREYRLLDCWISKLWDTSDNESQQLVKFLCRRLPTHMVKMSYDKDYIEKNDFFLALYGDSDVGKSEVLPELFPSQYQELVVADGFEWEKETTENISNQVGSLVVMWDEFAMEKGVTWDRIKSKMLKTRIKDRLKYAKRPAWYKRTWTWIGTTNEPVLPPDVAVLRRGTCLRIDSLGEESEPWETLSDIRRELWKEAIHCVFYGDGVPEYTRLLKKAGTTAMWRLVDDTPIVRALRDLFGAIASGKLKQRKDVKLFVKKGVLQPFDFGALMDILEYHYSDSKHTLNVINNNSVSEGLTALGFTRIRTNKARRWCLKADDKGLCSDLGFKGYVSDVEYRSRSKR